MEKYRFELLSSVGFAVFIAGLLIFFHGLRTFGFFVWIFDVEVRPQSLVWIGTFLATVGAAVMMFGLLLSRRNSN